MSVSTARQKSHLAAIGLAVVIFCAGGLAGVAIDRMWLSSSSPDSVGHTGVHDPDAHVERFRILLNLTDAQTQQIREILGTLHTKAEAVHTEKRHTLRAEHERARDQIHELLTPVQRVAYEELLKKLHAKHRGPGEHGPHRKRHGHGHGTDKH